MSYTTLRREGIAQLERMAGERWTDFNPHDPGITILEELCYALSDLGYRIGHDIPDLLAEGGGDPYESLHPAAEILACRAVTPEDLRRVVLDVAGVRNAWVEAEAASDRAASFYYEPRRRRLTLDADPLERSERVELRGLYRVSIEILEEAGLDGTEVRAEALARIQAHRNLGEDFTKVEVLDRQPIQVDLGVEIAAVEDVGRLLLGIYRTLHEAISPAVPFLTLGEALAAGMTIDRIFEGPRPSRGFVTDEALRGTLRRSHLNSSDLIHELMDLPGVRAVRTLSLRTGEETAHWSLRLDPSKSPHLDWRGSTIELRRAGIPVAVDAEKAQAAFVAELRREAELRALASASGGAAWEAPPPGRDRRAGRYRSVQLQFPEVYGIGELGLPASAPPARRAQAHQLKAYLMFFDQILANQFAQLAHVKDLFSFADDRLETYFFQPVPDPEGRLGLGDLLDGRAPDPEGGWPEEMRLAEEAAFLPRKHRFLDHLLARFAEQITEKEVGAPDDAPGEASELELARAKLAFLRRYPELSGGRGSGVDYLEAAEPGAPPPMSGLERRLRLKLGLEADAGEDLLLVEHILLRPLPGDRVQTVPFLEVARLEDPFSCQLSFLLPDQAGRLGDATFRRFVVKTLREETPAHLVAYIRWLGADAWANAREAWTEVLAQRRQLWLSGPRPSPSPGPICIYPPRQRAGAEGGGVP